MYRPTAHWQAMRASLWYQISYHMHMVWHLPTDVWCSKQAENGRVLQHDLQRSKRSVAEDYWRPEAEALLRKHGVEYWCHLMAGCQLVAGVSHRLRACSCRMTSFGFRTSASTRKTKTCVKTRSKNKEKVKTKTFKHVLNDWACPDQNPKFWILWDDHAHTCTNIYIIQYILCMLNIQNSSLPTLHRKQSCGWQSHVSRSVMLAWQRWVSSIQGSSGKLGWRREACTASLANLSFK